MRPWVLAETNYQLTRDHQFEVAVLPLGATEPHNLHLPYATDVFEANEVGLHICGAAHERGANVVLLPTIPYGTQTNMFQMPLAMNLYPATLTAVISDLVESLVRSGIRKILLLNSHGGNEVKVVLRELSGRSEAQLFMCNWYKVFSDKYDEIFDFPDDHAGEMETSFALAYFPELVNRDERGQFAADEGAAAKSQFEALDRGWVSITRPWHLLTTNAGVGYPHQATADKGRRMMALLVDRLAQFLVDLSNAAIDDRFPFAP